MRKNIVAGNWKMNLSPSQAADLFKELNETNNWPTDVQMMLFPPALYLQGFAKTKGDHVMIGAQNFFQKKVEPIQVNCPFLKCLNVVLMYC